MCKSTYFAYILQGFLCIIIDIMKFNYISSTKIIIKIVVTIAEKFNKNG